MPTERSQSFVYNYGNRGLLFLKSKQMQLIVTNSKAKSKTLVQYLQALTGFLSSICVPIFVIYQQHPSL